MVSSLSRLSVKKGGRTDEDCQNNVIPSSPRQTRDLTPEFKRKKRDFVVSSVERFLVSLKHSSPEGMPTAGITSLFYFSEVPNP